MTFIKFPLRIETRGGLARAGSQEENIGQLLVIMARTSRRGWRGSPTFGMREMFEELGAGRRLQLVAIKQMNQAFVELGLDWMHVDKVEVVSNRGEYSSFSFDVTISCHDIGPKNYEIDI